MENPIKIDDLGVPLFLETPIYLTPRLVLHEPSLPPTLGSLLRGSGYLVRESNQGSNPYKWVTCPLINLYITR